LSADRQKKKEEEDHAFEMRKTPVSAKRFGRMRIRLFDVK
jgi:hypothetical protein